MFHFIKLCKNPKSMFTFFSIILFSSIAVTKEIKYSDLNQKHKKNIKTVSSLFNPDFFDCPSYLLNFNVKDDIYLDIISTGIFQLKDGKSGETILEVYYPDSKHKYLSLKMNNGKLDGQQLLLDYSFKIEGVFKDGELNGLVTKTSRGNIVATATYKNNKLNGLLTLNNENGKLKFVGNFKKGFQTGDYTFYNKKGEQVYKGSLNEGRGTFHYYENSKLQSIENIDKGLLEGDQILFDEELPTKSSLSYYRDGLQDGLEVLKLEAANNYLVTLYKKGLLHGPSFEIKNFKILEDTIDFAIHGEFVTEKEYLINSKQTTVNFDEILKNAINVIKSERL